MACGSEHFLADLVLHDGYLDFLEDGGDTTAVFESPPAGDGGHSASEVFVVSRKANWN